MDLTNALRKTYASLATVKGRRESGLFMAQGTKCVEDTLGAFGLEALLCTQTWADEHPVLARNATIVKKVDIERIATLSTAPGCIAIYQIPASIDECLRVGDELVLALDCVQDPGNLGTIMRVADWMGVRHIFASKDTADVWSPKVVQATMGAISRVKVHYVDLPAFLEHNSDVPIYGTFLDGEDIYRSKLSSNSIIVMGNEGKGISDAVARHVSHRLFIPPYPPDAVTSESLNVAIATAITLSVFRRSNNPHSPTPSP